MSGIRSFAHTMQRAAAAATIVVAVVAVPAFGRLNGELRITIPFAFHAGAKVMPSGEYAVKDLANGALAIRATDAGKQAIVLSRVETSRTVTNDSPSLVFNRYGDECFLTEVRTGWDESIYKVPMTSVEQQLARAESTPREVLLIKATLR